jgi:hypothetical protein
MYKGDGCWSVLMRYEGIPVSFLFLLCASALRTEAYARFIYFFLDSTLTRLLWMYHLHRE